MDRLKRSHVPYSASESLIDGGGPLPMLTTSPGLRHSHISAPAAATNLSGRWRQEQEGQQVCDLPISASTVGNPGQQLCPGETKTEAHGELLTRPDVRLQAVLQTEMSWLLSLRLDFRSSQRAPSTQVYSRSPCGSHLPR